MNNPFKEKAEPGSSSLNQGTGLTVIEEAHHSAASKAALAASREKQNE